MVICATEIKKKGIIWIGKFVDKYGELLISVRGKNKYIVMSIAEYERLKSVELKMTLNKNELKD